MVGYPDQMSSEASRLAVSIGGVEERVSSEAKLVQAERTYIDKQKDRLRSLKVQSKLFGSRRNFDVEWLACRWTGNKKFFKVYLISSGVQDAAGKLEVLERLNFTCVSS